MIVIREPGLAEAGSAVTAARGTRIRLADGREWVDGTGCGAAACHGYDHPHLRGAVARQLAATPHGLADRLVEEQATMLAQRLAGLAPDGLGGVRLHATARDAMDAALQRAQSFWRDAGQQRTKVATFGGGRGDSAPDRTHPDLPRDEAGEAALRDWLDRHAGAIAALVVEPLVQRDGLVFHDESCLKRLRHLATEHDVLLICDERFTGFGRTGPMFASLSIAPDILVLGEGLAGGIIPLAATLTSETIAGAADFAAWSGDASSVAANALACAAANASLDLFEREPRLLQSAEIAKKMGPALGACLGLPHVKDVRVRGAIGVIELDIVADAATLQRRFAEAGVWVRPEGSIIPLTPALTIGEDDLARLTAAVCDAVAAL
ncbi:MAG TPA: aminotransferase class III-fold pyridoxal phosphate-dependent enzyme [Rhizomicrobium sp.]|jgi:adenosylmethionine-8-amino-7-oxononanoate aminotransferase